MCGRYALGAAHLDLLEGLQGQYARLFPGRRDDDGRVRGGGPQRLRGGGAGGESESKSKSEGEGNKATEVSASAPEAGVETKTTDATTAPAATSSSQPASSSQGTKPTERVADKVGIVWEREQDFWPSYNIAPRQRAPVARRNPSDSTAVMLETMQWGLIPHWTKHPPTGALNTINARSEALIDPSSGGMWHALKGYKRCVIPAQGYYEWQKKGATKVAHFARLPLSDGETASAPPILFFAGLWDTVKYESPVPSKFVPTDENDDREPYPTGNPVPLSTFTILTTTPAPDIAWLHDRMPCILTDEDEIARWLDLGEVRGWEDGKGGTGDLLQSFRGLTAYPVVPEVGKIGHSQPNYILPVAERKDGIKSFFQKAAGKESKPSKVETKPPAKPKAEAKTDAAADKKTGVKEEAKPSVKEEDKAVKEEHKRGVKDEDKKGVKDDSKDDEKAPEDKPNVGPTQTIKAESKYPHHTRSMDKRAAAPDVVVVDDDDDTPISESSQSSAPPPPTPTKRKRDDRPAGRQTKITRPPPEKEGQKSITSFFKSPRK